jgi:hypothetical protein
LREEEDRQREGSRLSIDNPRVHELDSIDEILHPRAESLERGKGNLFPDLWEAVVETGGVHGVKVRGHDDEATDSFFDITERGSHARDQSVESGNRDGRERGSREERRQTDRGRTSERERGGGGEEEERSESMTC